MSRQIDFSPENDFIVAQSYLNERDRLLATRALILGLLVRPDEANCTVLDVCCGIGETPHLLVDTLHLLNAKSQVTCIDRSPQMLAIARARSNGAKFLQMQVTPESLAALAKYDIVIMQAAIHWFDNTVAILAAALRQTRKRFYISTTVEKEDSTGFEKKADVAPYFRKRMTQSTFLEEVDHAIELCGVPVASRYAFNKIDPFGKLWINVVICMEGTQTPPIGELGATYVQCKK